MTDRKDEIAWLEEMLREIQAKHNLCPHCGEHPKEPETELCENCTLLAMYERAMAGEE